MNFYKLKEAATAIAAVLYPANSGEESEGPRQDAERSYLAALQHAVCEDEIVYRDPGSKLPIHQDGIAAFMTSHWCVVSVADLNAWLQAKGIGVQVPSVSSDSDHMDESADTTQEAGVVEPDWPTSAQLADALGPYLVDGRDGEWLKRRLNDADRYADLLKYRRKEGRRPVARWNAGGVTVYLIALKELTWKGAKAALEKHYPDSLGVLDGLGQREEKAPAQWFPTTHD
ncbi:hypothetical protein CH72_2387 [Burkholderia ambifaria AMMD]|nr:hypothetical protein [Burkholderia ambifaria]AJY20869.1 hypothetical protein CH72_2387 [Burkholderia ambifaria AMMD]MBR7932709.1 hypothetical protein [Burkholderia ambifaria]QQC04843.1 hypothetical protein I6H84_02705 [Burkholderia ambifaria]UZU04378.1 hypothetical protein OR987_29535 [Burkholderia ambifaria]UZU10929.1 hypothetical protein OR988_29525 [Burkholderia ambifaria]